jgi:large subunit ribosomal protein L9
MAIELLLLEDVEALGRKGQVVRVRPGYARNMLLPRKLAVRADANALRQIEKLKEQRRIQAEQDLKESKDIAARMEGLVVHTTVKVDHEGSMYGSVTTNDLVTMLNDQHKIEIGKRDIQLKHPIKTVGDHKIAVKLKEGVESAFTLSIAVEGATQA